MLTGLNFFSRSFFFKIGLRDATFAFSEKTFFVISLFIMFAKWESITFADIFTIFGGILSRPVAFLGSISFIILFISSVVAVQILFIVSMLGWFL